MIVDHLRNWGQYRELLVLMDIFDILRDPNLAKQELGRHDIKDKRGIYYILQKYTTSKSNENSLERHRKYMDIQYICQGEEMICHTSEPALEEMTAYDEKNDISFYKPRLPMNRIWLSEGTFALFLPQDAHMPKMQCRANPSEVIKAVVKIPMTALR